MVEVAVATFLIVLFLILIFVPQDLKTESDVKEICFKALKVLDESNQLREYALRNDTESIRNKLANLLPYYFSYDVFVCSENCKIDGWKEERIRISYLLAGDFGKFKPMEIVLMVRR
ncbi:MAG: hypothetical protein NZ942_02670 [Candidatus Aenigmarchaeota archaeon]|nr:hypothetical protein [Candidatus Aenigmarchaeota archaeon]